MADDADPVRGDHDLRQEHWTVVGSGQSFEESGYERLADAALA